MKLFAASFMLFISSLSSLAYNNMIDTFEKSDIGITINTTDKSINVDNNPFNTFGLFLKITNSHYSHRTQPKYFGFLWKTFYPILRNNLERSLNSAVERDDDLSFSDADTLRWLLERLDTYNPYRRENETYAAKLGEYFLSLKEKTKKRNQEHYEVAEQVLPEERFGKNVELYSWYLQQLEHLDQIENRREFANSMYLLNTSARMQLGDPLSRPRQLPKAVQPPIRILNEQLPMPLHEYIDFIAYKELIFKFATPKERFVIDLAHKQFEKETKLTDLQWKQTSPIVKLLVPKIVQLINDDLAENGNSISENERIFRVRSLEQLKALDQRLKRGEVLLLVHLDWLYSWIENTNPLLIKNHPRYDLQGYSAGYQFSTEDFDTWMGTLTDLAQSL